jgi:hypothetical protein
MAKVFGYVELTGEGQKNLGIGAGPFPVIDLDNHFGVEILDHNRISHWIMKGQFNNLEQSTLAQKQYETACGQFRHVHDVQGTMKIIKQLVETQGQDGNWNYSEGMAGMFNGMELILAILEGREPSYRTVETKSNQTIYDQLLADADQEEKFAQALFDDGDKQNSHYRDGYASGIRKAVKTIQER